MKIAKLSVTFAVLAMLGFTGCGSSDSSPDETPDGGETLYGISPGTYCYKITSVSAVNDGCDLGVANMVGSALPGTYDASTGILTLGTQGSLGGGVITYNKGTLVRQKGTMSDLGTPGCSWDQEDTTQITMTAQNQFTAAVTEKQDSIAPACGFASTSCVSTWTWTFVIDGTLTPPSCK